MKSIQDTLALYNLISKVALVLLSVVALAAAAPSSTYDHKPAYPAHQTYDHKPSYKHEEYDYVSGVLPLDFNQAIRFRFHTSTM